MDNHAYIEYYMYRYVCITHLQNLDLYTDYGMYEDVYVWCTRVHELAPVHVQQRKQAYVCIVVHTERRREKQTGRSFASSCLQQTGLKLVSCAMYRPAAALVQKSQEWKQPPGRKERLRMSCDPETLDFVHGSCMQLHSSYGSD